MKVLKKLAQLTNRPDSVLHRSNRQQLYATLIVNTVIFSHGIGIGWVSPTLAALLSPNSPLDFPITINDVSWIGSLVGLGAVVGNIFFGLIMDKMGRKVCICLLAVPQTMIWLLIYFAKNVEYLYACRFLAGLGGGGGYCVIGIYTSEIADPRIRGTLGSIMMLSVNCGILVGLIMCSHLSYHLIPVIVIALPIMYFVRSLFLPETPLHLLRKGKIAEGEKSFKYYRNCSDSTKCIEMQKCNEEFEELKANMLKEQDNAGVTMSDFTNRRTVKAFCISLILMFVNQFCGSFAFVNYMSRIFDESGSVIDSNSSSIITGAVQIIGSYTATFFVDRYGRKILLLISTAGMCLSLSLTGVYTYFASTTPALAAYNWIPLVLMQCYIFIANIGIVPLTIVVLVEMMPTKLRSFGTSFGMIVLSVMVFAMLKIFPIYLHNFGISVTMWSCAAVSLFGFLIFIFFLEETKGKSLIKDEQK